MLDFQSQSLRNHNTMTTQPTAKIVKENDKNNNHPAKPSLTQTYSGLLIDTLNPDPKLIRLEDIVHGLSNTPRFHGQTRWFYPVLQHSVLVYHITCMLGGTKTQRIGSLFHDGAEGYMLDLASPIKNREEFSFYRERESHMENIILRKFLGDEFLSKTDEWYRLVKQADVLALFFERNIYMTPSKKWTTPDLTVLTSEQREFCMCLAEPRNTEFLKVKFFELYTKELETQE